MADYLNIYILNRADLFIKSYNRSFQFEINRDYLTNEKSSFNIEGNYSAQQGDFILVKSSYDNLPIYSSNSGLRPLYFGVIDSFDNNSIVACDLYNIVNFEFAATRKTGQDFGTHIQNLLNYYLDSSKLVSKITWDVDDSARIAYSYQPSDPPTITNMVDYLINGFKKYNVTLEIDSISYDENNSLQIGAIIKQKTNIIQIKNNTYDFVNWDVYENTVGRDLENELIIINKTTTDSENPIVIEGSPYYLSIDGRITQSVNDNVWNPTKTKIYIYDSTQIDIPTPLEIAESELVGNTYAHEINFDITKDNKIIPIETLEIGLLANIVYGDSIYSSVLTGYIIKNNSSFISLKFGNTRSTLREILKIKE